MSTRIQVTSKLGALAKRVQRVQQVALTRAALKAAEHAAGQIRREVASWTSRTSTRKTGALARSFVGVLVKSGAEGIRAEAKSSLPYARIHDQGGIIRPKGGKYLTIPITPAARRRRARDFPGLVFIHKKPHLPVLALVSKGVVRPQYILRTSVRITAKHYIQKATDTSREACRKIIEDAVRQLLRAA